MQNISTQALKVKSQWLLEDQKFFTKYRKDKKAMQIINALAEMIASFEFKPKEPIFSC